MISPNVSAVGAQYTECKLPVIYSQLGSICNYIHPTHTF